MTAFDSDLAYWLIDLILIIHNSDLMLTDSVLIIIYDNDSMKFVNTIFIDKSLNETYQID